MLVTTDVNFTHLFRFKTLWMIDVTSLCIISEIGRLKKKDSGQLESTFQVSSLRQKGLKLGT